MPFMPVSYSQDNQLIPTQLAPSANPFSMAPSFVPGVDTQQSGGGLGSGMGILGELMNLSPGGLGASLLTGGVGGIFQGLGASMAAAAQRRQMQKLKDWEFQRVQQTLSPQALSNKGMYVNPYSQGVTDTYTNAVMGNLMSKLGQDTLSKWGINFSPVSSAGETGSTQNQMAQYSKGNAQALLNKYGFGQG